jgi:hypothetical protein
VITLEEAEHHFPSRRRQQMEALRTGFVAMLFFILLAVALAFVFSRMFGTDSGPSSTGNQLGAYAGPSPLEASTRIEPVPSRTSPIRAAA